MKRNVVLFLAALLVLACHGPLEKDESAMATVQIGFSFPSSDAARTIVPNFAPFVKRIEVTFTSATGLPPVTGFVNAAPWEVNLPVAQGIWDITVVVKDAVTNGAEIGRGTLTGYKVEPVGTQSATIPIVFAEKGSDGIAEITLSLPGDLEIDSVKAEIEGGASQNHTLAPSAGTISDTFTFTGLSTQTYTLVLTFKRGAVVAGVFREKIMVTKGYTSDFWVKSDGTLESVRAFNKDNFFENNAELSNLVIENAPADFAFESDDFDYPLKSMITPPAYIAITPAESVPGQYIEYSWAAWNTGNPPSDSFNEIRSGTKSINLATAEANKLLIRVTPPDRGPYSEYKVEFRKGYAVTVTMAPYGSITLTASPSNATISRDGTAKITISAAEPIKSGASAWHWYLNGDEISGATGSSYEWDPPSTHAPGQYLINVDALYKEKSCTGYIRVTVTY